LGIQLQAKENEVMKMMIMSPNKKWSDLTAREKAPFVLRGIVQVALLTAALVDIHRRPPEEINGSKWVWRAVALVNFMGIGPIAYFLFGRKRA
jgi:Phospholipase_D-nuclease N-terminal